MASSERSRFHDIRELVPAFHLLDEEIIAHRFSDIDSFPIGFSFGVGTTVRSSVFEFLL